ncbi:MAG: hypothetical protein JW744_01470 [Candidatus Diapherotrites archaeon]|uniref:Uncharacterized protein n=1 Tax=Candidatus Iainarchaeum sp. TaxID=3101447 RepID=A0A938YTB9_9ARCH|nr:hypothetical protein [Candidatus Diapherotrites archaeon]
MPQKLSWNKIKLAIFSALAVWFFILFLAGLPPYPYFLMQLLGFEGVQSIQGYLQYFSSIGFWINSFLYFIIAIQAIYIAWLIIQKAFGLKGLKKSKTSKAEELVKTHATRTSVHFFHYAIVAFVSGIVFAMVLTVFLVFYLMGGLENGQANMPENADFFVNLFFVIFFGILAGEQAFWARLHSRAGVREA